MSTTNNAMPDALPASDARLLDTIAFKLLSAGLDRAADAIYAAITPDERSAIPVVERAGNVFTVDFTHR